MHVRRKNENTCIKLALLILMFVAFFSPSFAVVNCTGKKIDAKKNYYLYFELEVMKRVGSWGCFGLCKLVTPPIDCQSLTVHPNASACIPLALSAYFRG